MEHYRLREDILVHIAKATIASINSILNLKLIIGYA